MNFISDLSDLKIYAVLIIVAILFIYFLTKKDTKKAFPYATPMLDRFSRDLSREARENRIDPIIGREDETKRLIQILSRRTKNNVILVGEAGTGKTALAEGLALAIVSKKVSPILQQKRVLALNLGDMLAGTQYRGEFEQRMKAITDEIFSAGRNIILFIDEIHNLTQAGESSGAIGAANLLKPALARGDIQAVGACTTEDYFQYIRRDASLERRFQPVLVEESTPEETLKILQGIKSRYEEFHQVMISDEVMKKAVDLANQYLSDRYFPDKAIDLLDEAAAITRLEAVYGKEKADTRRPSVTIKAVEDVVFRWGRDIVILKKKEEISRK